jgi:alkanesulfonate monooxygenase SsuD/methylene tetrahydromethanopterin reductase-like flavin-dependent oxidoreductase (luciferase family)
MRLGWLVDQRLPWPQLVARAADLEASGFTGLWLSDHLIDEDDRWLLDCWTTAAALLVATQRTEVGTLVAANTLRHPILTAHMAWTLSSVAPGRFVLGLGAGGSEEEHRAFGLPFPDLRERAARLEEACQLITAALGNRSGGFTGQYYNAAPVREGGPAAPVPLLVGGGSDEVLAVTARHADRWTIWAEPAELARRRARLAEACALVGRDVDSIHTAAIVMVTPAHSPLRFSGQQWPAVMSGDAPQLREQLAEYARAGARELVLCDYAVAVDHQVDMLRWFAEQVVLG